MKPPVMTHETPFNPALSIVDTHTHLWNMQGYDFFAPDLLTDIAASGHSVEATIYAECDMRYLTSGPAELRAVGETVHAVEQAKLAEGGPVRINAAILGAADMQLGARVQQVLEAHVDAGEGRFRGIRHRGAWHPDPAVQYDAGHGYPDHEVLAEPTLLEAAKVLERMGLIMGNWIFHTQLGLLADLAAKVPGLTMTLNHMGGPLGYGPYAAKRNEVFQTWRAALKMIAQHDNGNHPA